MPEADRLKPLPVHGFDGEKSGVWGFVYQRECLKHADGRARVFVSRVVSSWTAR